jgi:O-antigen/teichoic acid export membrane protein
MSVIRKLAGQTAIYGLSSIVSRLLNYLLVPIYTRVFLPQQYGVVTELYAYVTFIIILFTYGMETAFFHFTEKEDNREKVYGTALISLLCSSVILMALLILFSYPIASLLRYPDHPEYIVYFAVILAADAISSIPFARLRQQNKAKKFALLKTINILVNIGLNLFFLVACPVLLKSSPGMFRSVAAAVYDPAIGVGYVFISNLVASVMTLLLLFPEVTGISLSFNSALWKKMILYALPLLIGGLAGMVNETLDRAILKSLLPDKETAMYQLGIYGACYKIPMLMTLFIQTYRYAAEPFFFAQINKENNTTVYATVMKYFVLVCAFIFLAIMMYIDIIKHFVGEEYRSGLPVVPILLIANMCFGIFINLSMWYKLTGHTRYGAYFTIFGASITILLNILLIPRMGYMGAAWATLVCYFCMMIMSYVTGQKYFPVRYDLKKILFYIFFALALYFANITLHRSLNLNHISSILFNTATLLLFVAGSFFSERPKKQVI